MASIRDLKKDINYVLGDFIETVYLWEKDTNKANADQSNALIEKAINVFDDLMTKVNQKDIGNAKTHFKSIRTELGEQVSGLITELGQLSN